MIKLQKSGLSFLGVANGSQLPAYRLRLFLSVDLVGSTAFKAGEGNKPASDRASQPVWVQRIRSFYQEFPRLISQHYQNKCDAAITGNFPQVWKTIGDEIIFCCRLINLKHLSCCIEAFLQSLVDYGGALEKAGNHLDVKGNCWVAAFPTPNITVALRDVTARADQFDEAFEALADANPRSVDFLGNSIDCGFRLASRSSADRCSISLELAWLLADALSQRLVSLNLNYHERHVLKGVLNERPYPIFSVDTERNHRKKELRDREALLITQKRAFQPFEVREFLSYFMQEHGIEPPHLESADGISLAPSPESYRRFCEAWQLDEESVEHQRSSEEAAEKPENAAGESEIPTDVVEGFRTALEAALEARIIREE